MNSLYSFFLLFISGTISSQIRFENIQDSNNNYLIPLCIGTPPQCFTFKLSTSLNEVIVLNGRVYNNGYYPRSDSKTYFDLYSLKKEYHHETIQGFYFSDSIFINHEIIRINYFKMIMINSGVNFTNFSGIIGLGNDYTEYGNQTNLMAMLFKENYVSYPVYTIGKGNFIIGDDISKKKNYKYCHLNSDKERWGLATCNINSVMYHSKGINHIEEYTRTKVRFDIDFNEIYCPSEFFEFLTKEVFRDLLFEEWCAVNKENYALRTIVCYKEAIDTFKNEVIYFFIGNWSMKLRVKELFIKGKFQIFHGNWNQDWLFGNIVMNSNSITIDKGNNKLYFNA